LRHCQRIDVVVLAMRADEFYEGDLATKIEGDHEPIVSAGDLKPCALSVEHLRFRSCGLNIIHRCPMCCLGQPVPAFERNLRLWVLAPKGNEHLISSRHPDYLNAFNTIFRNASYDYFLSANLARHFHAAGLKDVRTEALLAHTDDLDSHPFWRAFIFSQIPMFVHGNLIEEAIGQAFLADLEELNQRGEFSASFIVQVAVGTK